MNSVGSRWKILRLSSRLHPRSEKTQPEKGSDQTGHTPFCRITQTLRSQPFPGPSKPFGSGNPDGPIRGFGSDLRTNEGAVNVKPLAPGVLEDHPHSGSFSARLRIPIPFIGRNPNSARLRILGRNPKIEVLPKRAWWHYVAHVLPKGQHLRSLT